MKPATGWPHASPGPLFYETCDQLLAGEATALLEGLRAFPQVPLAPHHDSPRVERHIAESLALVEGVGFRLSGTRSFECLCRAELRLHW